MPVSDPLHSADTKPPAAEAGRRVERSAALGATRVGDVAEVVAADFAGAGEGFDGRLVHDVHDTAPAASL